MFTSYDVKKLAVTSPSQIGQMQLFRSGHAGVLSMNESLHEEIWHLVWDSQEGHLDYLVRSAKSMNQVEKVLSTAPLEVLVKAFSIGSQRMNSDLLIGLCKKLSTGSYVGYLEAALCLVSGQLPAHKVRPFLKAVLSPDEKFNYLQVDVGPAPLDTELRSQRRAFLYEVIASAATQYSVLTDLEVATMLDNSPWLASSDGTYDATAELQRKAKILDLRPGVVKSALGNKPTIRMCAALAVSRHLSDVDAFQLLKKVEKIRAKGDKKSKQLALEAIIQNPNTSLRTKSEAHRVLSKLISSSSADAQLGAARTRALNGPVVGVNPWDRLSDAEILGMLQHSTLLRLDLYPSLPVNVRRGGQVQSFEGLGAIDAQVVRDEVSPRLDALGPAAWDIFIGLLPNWDEGLQELLSTTSHLLR